MRVSGTTTALLLGAAIHTSTAMAATQVEELTRTGPWVANFDQNACHLVGQFGTGDTSVSIKLTRYAPGDTFDLTIYGARYRSTYASVRAGVTFNPGAKIVKSEQLAGTAGKLPMIIVGKTRLDGWSDSKDVETAPLITPAMEAAIISMDIEATGIKRVRLVTGSMGKTMAMMRTCMKALIKEWGFDPSVELSLSRPVQPASSPANWLRSDDYPSGALEKGHNGLVNFRVDIDSKGKVESCHILSATKPSDFELATCKGITRRARFVPALDASGQPVRSFHVNTVKWLAGY